SKNTTPAFSGTATDGTKVTVDIYAGGKAEGTVVASATATPSGGEWSSGNASPALAEGTYTAQASQPSSLGNPAGHSEAVTFTVVTASPEVSITPLSSPTGNSTPTLEGGAGIRAVDNPDVTVTIYAGAAVGGTIAASGEAPVKGGGWTFTSPHLADGTYTAQATQGDKAGNSKSVTTTFTINTASPTVTLNQPASPSKNTTPAITGTATAGTKATPN